MSDNTMSDSALSDNTLSDDKKSDDKKSDDKKSDTSTTPPLSALSDLENGAVAVVEQVSTEANGHLRRRLMEMGLVRGTRVRLVKRAPFGDPIELRVGAYSLTLRRDEACHVKVRPSTS